MPLKFWIKQRLNPQLGTYYVPMGQLSQADAKKHEKPIYGDNIMLPFDSQGEYQTKIKALQESNAKVRLSA